MPTERRNLVIKSATPPTIEFDSEAASVYLRFKRAAVARTVPRPCEAMQIAVDLDAHGEVVGIEAVGVTRFSIDSILRKANVKAPATDFTRAKFIPTNLAEEEVAA